MVYANLVLLRSLFNRFWPPVAVTAVVYFAIKRLSAIDTSYASSTTLELFYLVAVYVATALLIAFVAAAVLSLACWPFVVRSKRPKRLLCRISQILQVSALFVCLLVFAMEFRHWLRVLIGPQFGFVSAGFTVLLGLAGLGGAAWAVLKRRPRRALMNYSHDMMGGRATRRAVLVGGALSFGMAIAGPDPARRIQTKIGPVPRGRRPNVLLVTFDALGARHTTLNGSALPTTPFLEEFAASSWHYANLISSSTFTTTSVASMLTGRYPNEHKLYDLGASLHDEDVEKSLPHLLRKNGYMTAASVTNPNAHPIYCLGIPHQFDLLPLPTRVPAALTDPVRDLQKIDTLYDAGVALDSVVKLFARDIPKNIRNVVPSQRISPFPPVLSFRQGLQLLSLCRKTDRPFFLWLHLFAPHDPYLPMAPFRGMFLKDEHDPPDPELVYVPNDYRYDHRRQDVVDRMHLRYSEWVAQCDTRFREFFASAKPMLDDTAVIVSADHGESFHGVLTHNSRYQAHDEIHIPLVIKLPGHTAPRSIDGMVEQTALAPTILDICGLKTPDFMHNASVLSASEEVAFTQFLSGNSPFEPARKGTIGAVDGHHQYVFDIASRRGTLRRWNDTRTDIDADHSAEAPDVVRRLRAAMAARFPTFFKT